RRRVRGTRRARPAPDRYRERARRLPAAMTGALHRQLRDFAVAGAFAIVIASVAFVAVRNREVIERQFDLADRSALAVSEDREPLPTVHGAIVGPSTP